MKRVWLFVPFLALLILGGLQGGCQRSCSTATEEEVPTEPPWFADRTEEAGLTFQHDAGPLPGAYLMPQMIGSGAALFDFNGDDRLDLYLLQNGGPKGARNRLYEQQRDGSFRDVSAGSGLDIAGHNMGVAIGDVNNDGRPDVLVTQLSGVKLFLNLGRGKFKDVTAESGLRNSGWGTSAAFFDFDRDGWLDLVIVNYVEYDPTLACNNASGVPDYCAPRSFKGHVARLFHNRGDGKGLRFQDVTLASGLGRLAGPGLGVLCVDFDGDGWPDIFIANDGEPNRLWMNQHDGTFKEEAIPRGVAYNAMGQAEAGMGIAAGDVDGDGLFDLYVTHLAEENNRLWKQGPRGLFQDRTAALGLVQSRWHGTGFGAVLGDFNLDGALDLAIVNGRVSKGAPERPEELGPHWSLYAQRNQLFANDGSGHFRDVSLSSPALCGKANVARGLAYGDIDNDGRIDLLVTTVAGPARLYRNVAPKGQHWLRVRAIDPAHGARDALGAEVRLRAGGKTQMRWINPATSYLCSNDPRAHFGLGSAERVDEIVIRWPDGSQETFPGVAADQPVVLRKGEGKRRD
jgi:hypothetical protein